MNLRSLIFILFFILISNGLFSQTVTFRKTYPIGVKNDVGYDVIEMKDGGYVITGFNTLVDSTVWKSFLMKINAQGNMVAKYDYGSSNDNGTYRFQRDTNGNFILAGYSLDSIAGKYRMFAMKIDSSFNLLWEKEFPIILYDANSWIAEPMVDVILLSDTNYIISASDNISITQQNIFITKLFSNGDTVWTRKYSQQGYMLSAPSIIETSDSGFIVTGYARDLSNGYNNNLLVLKLNTKGVEQWRKIHGDVTYSMYGNDILEVGNGYIIAGKKYSTEPFNPGGTYEAALFKVDLSGDLLWMQSYPYVDIGIGNAWDDIFAVVQKANDGGFYLAGFAGGTANNKEVFLIKTDTGGTETWQKFFGNPSEDVAYSLKYTADSGLMLSGYSVAGEWWDVYLIKTKDAPPDSCTNRPVITCSVDTVMLGTPTIFNSTVQSGTPPYNYIWSGTGGFSSTDVTPVYTYSFSSAFTGTFFYTVYVTDSNDCVGIFKGYTHVLDPCDTFPLEITCSSDTVQVGTATTFISTVQGGVPPYTYLWSGLGGLAINDPTGNHFYNASGLYYYQLRVKDFADCWLACEDYAVVKDTCSYSLIVTCSADTVFPKEPPPNKIPTQFTSSIQGGVPPYSYYWIEGSQFRDTVPNPSFIFKWLGNYNYLLYVKDSNGCSGFSNGIAYVQPVCYFLPPITITCSADTVMAGNVTTFTSTVQGGKRPYTYYWSGAGGFFDMTPNPVFTYDSAGIYSFSLWVFDSLNCSGSFDGYVMVNLPTNILEKQKLNNLITLIPNPFSTTATLQIYDLPFKVYDFLLFDVLGREVHRSKIQNQQSKIERGNLQNGMYYYQLKNRDVLVGTGKFIIN